MDERRKLDLTQAQNPLVSWTLIPIIMLATLIVPCITSVVHSQGTEVKNLLDKTCRREYPARQFEDRRDIEMAAIIALSKNKTCSGGGSNKVCPSSAARGLGFGPLPYTMAQENEFKDRWRKLDGALNMRGKVRPTPWLSFGNYLFTSRNRSEGEDPIYFYGNQYSDLSIFTHFFANPPVKNGVYVEIGGSNGWHASNTLFFEQHLGWTGYLIEPTPCAKCMLPTARPRDININAGACVTPKEIDGSFMYGFCPSPQDRCQPSKGRTYPNYKVLCRPMSTLLRSPSTGFLPEHIDLLSIDVEEFYMDFLETLPWNQTTMDVLLVEVQCQNQCSANYAARGIKDERIVRKQENERVSAFLEKIGCRVLRSKFNEDTVAVRERCVPNNRS